MKFTFINELPLEEKNIGEFLKELLNKVANEYFNNSEKKDTTDLCSLIKAHKEDDVNDEYGWLDLFSSHSCETWEFEGIIPEKVKEIVKFSFDINDVYGTDCEEYQLPFPLYQGCIITDVMVDIMLQKFSEAKSSFETGKWFEV